MCWMLPWKLISIVIGSWQSSAFHKSVVCAYRIVSVRLCVEYFLLTCLLLSYYPFFVFLQNMNVHKQWRLIYMICKLYREGGMVLWISRFKWPTHPVWLTHFIKSFHKSWNRKSPRLKCLGKWARCILPFLLA